MQAILEELGKIGIVPVVTIDDADKAVPLAKALAAGGIFCAEITLRTPQGIEAIRRAAESAPEVLVGAGTVLTIEQVNAAVDAGARFIVSPGFNPRVVEYCIGEGIPIIPGCAHPSDIEQAIAGGLSAVKFFPAEPAGGLEYIKAISAPYPQLQFVPTGGINLRNLVSYITFDKVLACGGSWMVSPDLINAGAFETITALSREAVLHILGFTVAHIGVNAGSEAQAAQTARLFDTLFGFAPREGAAAVFAGNAIELLKTSAPGAHGHIAIGTHSITRAMAYLERGGIAFRQDRAALDSDGALKAIYLTDEILGFAVHLLQVR